MRKETQFRLRELVLDVLRNKQMTHASLAEKSDMSEKQVTAVLNGLRRLTVRTAVKWEKPLGITAENLLYAQTLDEVCEERAIKRGNLEAYTESIAEFQPLEEVS